MATETKTSDSDRDWLKKNEDNLSDSTKRAQWINEPGREGDHDGATLATRSRDVVEDWARRRNAEPAAATRGDDGRPRVLRFDFQGGPDKGGRELEHISWDEWWQTFEERDLAFVYQEKKSDGNDSNFFILDSPNREDG
jgi:hypothetical protein